MSSDPGNPPRFTVLKSFLQGSINRPVLVCSPQKLDREGMATDSGEQDNFLRIGDLITLKYIRYQSHLSCEGLLNDEVHLNPNQHEFEYHLFQVCTTRQYSAKLEYEDFIKRVGDVNNIKATSDKKHYAALVKGKGNEMKMNESLMQHKMGNHVVFGEVIQLKHVKSKKYLTVKDKVLARDERENTAVHLSTEGNMCSWMQLLPRYKIDREGDRIPNNTEMVIRVAEHTLEHIHCADRLPSPNRKREVNASMEGITPWRVNIFQSTQGFSSLDPASLMCGQMVYFKDPEHNLCLTLFREPVGLKDHKYPELMDDASLGSATGTYFTGSIEGSHSQALRKEVENDDDEDSIGSDASISSAQEFIQEYGDITLKPMAENFVDSDALWVLEGKHHTMGGPIKWRTDQYHLRHVNTGKYLCLRETHEEDGNFQDYIADHATFEMTDNPGDKRALFNMYELHSQSNVLRDGKAIQMRQGGIGGMYIERSDKYDYNFGTYPVNGQRNKAKATNLIIHRYKETQWQGTPIEEVPQSTDIDIGLAFLGTLKKFIAASVVPGIRDSRTNSIWPDMENVDKQEYAVSMSSMVEFVRGWPLIETEQLPETYVPAPDLVYRRQCLLREQGSLELMIYMLGLLKPISERLSTGDAAAHQFNEGGLLSTASATISQTLKLVAELTTNNNDNQLYIAEFMPVILSHCGTELVAAEITQNMLNSNRELQETKIGTNELKDFADQLAKSQMNPMFIRLIKASCSCRGVGVVRNQIEVCNLLMNDYAHVLINVEMTEENVSQIDWNKMTSADLYLPAKGSEATMYGELLYTKGSPLLTMQWTNADSRLLPSRLFKKKAVKIIDIYEENDFIRPGHVDEQIQSSLFQNDIGNLLGSNKKSDLSEEEQKIKQFKNNVGAYVVAQIGLLSEMCLDRNYTVISQLREMYSFDLLLAIIRKRSTPSVLKAASVQLLLNLYIDCDPQTSFTLPRLTKTWSEVENVGAQPPLRSVRDSEKYLFGLLQILISDHVRALNNNRYSKHSLQMLQLLHKLLKFGFYGYKDRLMDIINPLVAALNRHDVEIDLEVGGDTESLAVSGKSGGSVKKGRRSSFMKRKEAITIDLLAKKKEYGQDVDLTNMKENDEEEANVPIVDKVLNLFESLNFTIFMLVLVIISVTFALYELVTGFEHLSFVIIDLATFAMFTIDVAVRATCYIMKRRTGAFFGDVFNLLDIAVVVIDIAAFVARDALAEAGSVSALVKVLRLLRLARLMKVVRIMRQIAANITGAEVFAVKWEEPLRYSKESSYNLKVMQEVTKILCTVQLTVEDRNVSLLMNGFYNWYKNHSNNDEDEEEKAKGAIDALHESVTHMEELRISSDSHDDIFIDLLMYKDPVVVQGSLNILMAHHSCIRSLLNHTSQLQLLVNAKRESQFKKMDDLILMLKREVDTHDIWGKLQTDEHKYKNEEAHRALLEIKSTCLRRREVLKFGFDFEPDHTIQDILRNLGCFDVCMRFVGLIATIDPNNKHAEHSRNTRTLALEASEILYWFLLENPTNQAMGYNHLQYFLSILDENIKAHKIIEAIFADNEYLMKSVPRQYIQQCVDLILNNGRFGQYLSLLTSICACGEKNMIDNQYEIIRLISSPGSSKRITLYFVPISHPEYNKKLKAMLPYSKKQDPSLDELPTDLAYHLNLISLLNGCTVGREGMTTIEAKVQSLYFFVDCIDALMDQNAIIITKIYTGLFLYNAVLDVEMRLPSLKDAACIWRLLHSFEEVFTFAKDDLRQIEKNTWAAATSSREKVEYMLVCAMIVQGYFELYFDDTVFRPEVGQSSNVERVQIREKKAMELISSLFFKIRSIYEMQSPLLSKEHQAILYNAMNALNEKTPNKIVGTIENVHSTVDEDQWGLEVMLQRSKQEEKISEFLSYIIDQEEVEEMKEDETQEFIQKLTKIPRRGEPCLTDTTVRFEPLLERLVTHISSTVTIVRLGEETIKSISKEATRTNIWLLKIFRQMIENLWGMTIDERDDDGGEEQDIAGAEIMALLNECGATKVCLELIGRGVDADLQSEAIKLIVALLFKEGGALDVQKTIFESLNKGDSDLFFMHVKSMLQDLMNWHKWHQVIDTRDENGEEGEVELPDNIILVRMLQLMCEGHFLPNQDIMRTQPNNHTKVNLLDTFVEYIQVLDDIKCRTSTDAATKVADVILEVIQGPCVGNQEHFATQTELLETLNRRMRNRVTVDCVLEEENGMKKTAIDIFQGLLEGQGHKTAVYDRVLSVIHLDVIQMMCAVDEDAEEEEDESAQELRMESLVLLQMLFDYKPEIREELGMSEEDIHASDEVACVELVWNGVLQRRFFPVPDICADISKSSKDNFIDQYDIDSPENKLHDLMEIAENMYLETLHQQYLKGVGIAVLFSKTNQDRANLLCFALALTINCLFCFYYENIICTPDFEWADDDESFEFPDCLEMKLPSDVNGVNIYTLVQTLGIILIFSASYNVLLCAVVKLPVLFESVVEKETVMVFGRQVPNSTYMSLLLTLMDFQTTYNLGYLLFATLSVQTQYHHLATFLLLDVIRLSKTTQDTLNAIWKPISLIAKTIVLTFIIVYIYAIFFFFEQNDEDNISDLQYTHTLVNAFKEFLRYGSTSGSLNNDMVQNVHTYRWIFDVSFFMVTFTMWNILKGITIDTFVELKQDQDARTEETTERCYICGINKLDFNRALNSRNAFDEHIKIDQNMWNYVYYYIFIQLQDKDDDDGLEYYVRHCIDATPTDLSWFPMNKAIRMMDHLEGADVGSLNHTFRTSLETLESEMDERMVLLKDQALRSITRVEQALVYVPEEKSTHKKKKKSQDASDEDEKSQVTEGGSMISTFRPGTGTVGATFMSGTAIDEEGNPRPLTAAERVISSRARRDESLSSALASAYMETYQVKVAIFDVNELIINSDIKSNIHVRIVSDVSIYTKKAATNEIAEVGAEESKGGDKLHKGEPIRFNENEWLVVHAGGDIQNIAQQSVLLQIMYEKHLDVPEHLSGSVPSTHMQLLCGASVKMQDIIKGSEKGKMAIHLKQEGYDDAYLTIGVKAPEGLMKEVAA